MLSKEDLSAYDAEWVQYVQSCDSFHFLKLPFASAFWNGVKWEPKISEALVTIDNFLAQDCKKYNESRNSPEKLAAFLPQLKAMSTKVTDAREAGLKVAADLSISTARLEKLQRELGNDPNSAVCLKSLQKRSLHVALRSSALLEKTKRIEELCPVAETAEAKPVKNTKLGQGAPTTATKESKAGATPANASDISGTKKAIEDAQQGSQKIK